MILVQIYLTPIDSHDMILEGDFKVKIFLFLSLLLSSDSWALDKSIVDFLKNNQNTVIYAPFENYSLDPLDSWGRESLSIAEFVLEPIFRLKDGLLYSNVLKRFFKDKNKVIFTVDKQATFVDGSPITPTDIEMVIKRNIYHSPGGSLNRIVGVEKWLKNKYPLEQGLEGIEIQDDRIILSFSDSDFEPFKWAQDFSFGIIPSKQIDKKTGKVIGKPLASGPYKIKNEAYPIVEFERRDGKKEVAIIGLDPNEWYKYAKYFNTRHFASVQQHHFFPENYNKFLSSGRIIAKKMPKSSVSFIRFEYKKPPFNIKIIRQYFADEARKTVRKSNREAEVSMFLKGVAGWMPHGELKKTVGTFSDANKKRILNTLSKHTLRILKKGRACHYYVEETAKRLGIKIEETTDEKEVHLRCFYSGISPVTPLKDYTFLLSKKGPFADYIDDNLENLLDNMTGKNPETIRNLNRYLYEDSVFSVLESGSLIHFITKDSEIRGAGKIAKSVDDYFTDSKGH